MHAAGSLLYQGQPGATAATAVVAVAQTEITRVVICNPTSTAETYSLFHDDDGGTYGTSTALVYEAEADANNSVFIESESANTGFSISAGGTLGVAGTSVVISIYGVVSSRSYSP